MPDQLGEKLVGSSRQFTPELDRVQGIKTRRRNRRNAGAGVAAVALLVLGVGIVNRLGDSGNATQEIEFATSVPEPTGEPVQDPTADPEAQATPEPDCPAVQLSDNTIQALNDLSPQGRITIDAIVDHITTNCEDLEGLAALTGPGFTAGFGGGTPVQEWEGAQSLGADPVGELAEILATDVGADPDGNLVWPAEAGETDDEGFSSYSGPRTAITIDGEWLYFVLGGA